MRKAFAKIILIGCLTVFSLSDIAAQQVEAVLDTKNIVIADTFFIDLKAIVAPNSSILWPEIGANVGDLEVNLEATTKVDSLKKDNEWILSQHLVLTSFDTGFFPIPPFHFIINEDTFSTKAQIVKISGVPIDTADLTIKPIKDLMTAPLTFMDIFWPWGTIVLVVIALLAGLIFYLKTRKKTIPPPIAEIKMLPHDWALEALSQLKKESLWQKGEVKEYYTRISDIFRQYIELRYQQPALESTTPEIMSRIKLMGLKFETIDRIQTTLTLADYVKFAKAKPVDQDHENAFEAVLQFVEATKIDLFKAQEEL
jgi:hypothetical protein